MLSAPNRPPSHGVIKLPDELSEKGLSAWLGELPLANIDYSGQALLTLLRTLNQAEDFVCSERLLLLERLRQTLFMLADRAIEMHLSSDVAFPLSHTVRRSASLGYLLCQELGRAYRRVAGGKHFFSERALDKATRARCIYRALEAYGESLLKSLVIYLPAPPDFWREVYGLYATAEQQGWHVESIAGGRDRSGATIQEIFKHILLFALANSQRHRPLEIRQIHAVIGQFAHLAELSDTPTSGKEIALFALSLNAGLPPFSAQSNLESGEHQYRYLLTRELIQQALSHFAAPENRRWEGIRMRRTMLKRLIHSLGAPERRKFRRFPLRAERMLTIGLQSLTSRLASEEKPEPQSLPPGSRTTVQVRGITLLNVPDYELQTTEEQTHGYVRRDSRSEVSAAGQLRGDQVQTKRDDIWKNHGLALSPKQHQPAVPIAWTVNSSAHGYCLCWVSRDLACARVDELIGVPAEDGSLNIGVVRWLSHDADENLLLGVELLSPLATPVGISVSGSFDAERRGLLLPVNDGLKLSSSLLTPPASFQLGQVVRLEAGGRSRSCRLERLIESNFSFNHFAVVESEV